MSGFDTVKAAEPTPCGGANERACCLNTHESEYETGKVAQGETCAAGLVEVPGCGG